MNIYPITDDAGAEVERAALVAKVAKIIDDDIRAYWTEETPRYGYEDLAEKIVAALTAAAPREPT